MRVATLIQQQFLPRELPEPAAVADRRLLRPGARRRWRLLRLHRDAATGGSASPSATSPTRASRPRWSWPGRIRSCAPRPAGATRPGEILARANALLVPEMPARMFVTCLFAILEPGDRPDRPGQRRPQPALHPDRRRRHRAARDRDAARPPARHPVRGDRGRHRPGQQRPALLGRPRRGPRPGPADVRLPAPARGDDASTTPAASCSIACSTRSTGSPAPTGSRRTTSRSSRCAEPPASPTSRPATTRCRARPSSPPSRSPARKATSASRWTASRPRSPTSGSRRPAPRAPQDGGQRGRHERHRVRQPGPAPTSRSTSSSRRPPTRSSSASPTAPCPAPSPTTPRRPTSSSSSPASRSRAAGASS